MNYSSSFTLFCYRSVSIFESVSHASSKYSLLNKQSINLDYDDDEKENSASAPYTDYQIRVK